MNLLPNSRGLFFCHIVNQLIQYMQEVEFYSNCWTSYPKAELLSEVVLHPMSDIGGGGSRLALARQVNWLKGTLWVP